LVEENDEVLSMKGERIMDSKAIIGCLGKTDDSPEVVKLLAGLGVKKKPKIPHDDIDARIDILKQGLSLVFEPREPKSSKLTFSAVQFFSGADEGFDKYTGILPNNLFFSDTQAEVRKKLGKPSDTMKELWQDIWEPEGLLMTVEYSGKGGQITMVAFDVPEDE
jgi:hypothetical protein